MCSRLQCSLACAEDASEIQVRCECQNDCYICKWLKTDVMMTECGKLALAHFLTKGLLLHFEFLEVGDEPGLWLASS